MKSKTVTKGAAQGDLLIVRVDAIPAGVAHEEAESGRLILARGEATGHHHSLPHTRGVALFRDAAPGTLYFRAEAPVTLDHQEHSTITFAPGTYKVTRQRTYHAGMARRVVD
jgi:hypothetical protein